MDDNQAASTQVKTKFCKHCGEVIDAECIICPKCGKQVEQLGGSGPVTVNVNNENTNTNTNIGGGIGGKRCDKIVSLLLCIFLGYLGIHKFYEGKVGMGVLYIFTLGLFGIGVIVDFITLLFKPNPYYV